MIKYPQKVTIVEHSQYGSDDDSDYEVISNNSDSEIVSSGYERLREDVQTVIVHETDSSLEPDGKENDNITRQSLESLNSSKINLNLSREQIINIKRDRNSVGPTNHNDDDDDCDDVDENQQSSSGSIKKSRSENLEILSSNEVPNLLSPALITRTGYKKKLSVSINLNDIESIKTREQEDVIYDVPRKRNLSVPAVSTRDIIGNLTKTISHISINEPSTSFALLNSDSSLNATSKLQKTSTSTTSLHSNRLPSALNFKSKKQAGLSKFLEDKFKCSMCRRAYTNPRILECLHTFCADCLEKLIENDKPSSTEPNTQLSKLISNNGKTETLRSCSGSNLATTKEKGKTYLFGRRNILNPMSKLSVLNKTKIIVCPVCESTTILPIGGVNNLPINYILCRQTNEALVKIGLETKIDRNFCQLCKIDVQASHFCLTCNIPICLFCTEAHLRQRSTSDHHVKNLKDLLKRLNTTNTKDSGDKTYKCPIHSKHEVKIFCTTCNQIACSDCTFSIHRGHKCQSISKASKEYTILIKNNLEYIRPISDYANHTISKLNDMSKKFTLKCNQVQSDVELFLEEYFLLLELHRTKLFNQIERTKRNKLELIKSHQNELNRRSNEVKSAVKFTEDLLLYGTDIEILSFVGTILNRFEHCQKSEIGLDVKLIDSIHFIREVRAPSTNPQNNIPIFGIITTQTAVPKLCTLETKELLNLRVNKKVELLVVSRDNSDRPLCYGGLNLIAELRYRDSSSRLIQTRIVDIRNGTYLITFLPDAPGYMTLAITIQGNHIKGSPFTLCAQKLRPHSSICYCCTYCSNVDPKTIKCGCGSKLEGYYQGCGNRHEGYPRQRHWSCCENLENSETSNTNMGTNSKQ